MIIHDASVAGSSLLSFAPEVAERERTAIVYGLRFAQLAANDLYALDPDQGWFNHFHRQLRFLGWDAQPPTEPYRPSRTRQGVLDAALDTVRAEQPYFHREAVAGVQALRADKNAVVLFERYARQHNYGMFQLLPCTRSRLASGVGVVDLLVYHEELEMQGASPGFFITETPLPSITARLGLVRFDTRAFETTMLPKIKARFDKPWEDGTYMRLLAA